MNINPRERERLQYVTMQSSPLHFRMKVYSVRPMSVNYNLPINICLTNVLLPVAGLGDARDFGSWRKKGNIEEVKIY